MRIDIAACTHVLRVSLASLFIVLSLLASRAESQTGPHGYVGGGFGVGGCTTGCPSGEAGSRDTSGLLGGGFAFPIVKDRLWVAGDEISQYQWENTTFFYQEFGPSGPVSSPSVTPMRLHEHFVGAGIAIR